MPATAGAVHGQASIRHRRWSAVVSLLHGIGNHGHAGGERTASGRYGAALRGIWPSAAIRAYYARSSRLLYQPCANVESL